MKRFVLAVLLGAAAVAAACESPFSPGPPAATYVLAAPAGDTLPVVLWTHEGHTLSVLADTIRLRSDGSGVHVRLQRLQPANSETTASPSSTRAPFAYRIVGERIEISYPCPPNANCIAPPHEIGRVTEDAIALESLPDGFVHHRR